jgi:hypothetical protein
VLPSRSPNGSGAGGGACGVATVCCCAWFGGGACGVAIVCCRAWFGAGGGACGVATVCCCAWREETAALKVNGDSAGGAGRGRGR